MEQLLLKRFCSRRKLIFSLNILKFGKCGFRFMHFRMPIFGWNPKIPIHILWMITRMILFIFYKPLYISYADYVIYILCGYFDRMLYNHLEAKNWLQKGLGMKLRPFQCIARMLITKVLRHKKLSVTHYACNIWLMI